MRPLTHAIAALPTALLVASVANAQAPPRPAPQAVERALDAPYLSEEERADMRVFHGVWEQSDLQEPARRARAALLLGVWDDPSLSDPAAASEDRAEALLLMGEPGAAVDALAGVATTRARRIVAQALHLLGKPDEANRAIDPIVEALTGRPATDAAELVEAVRALRLRARIEGRPAQDYRAMLDLLVQARELDRLHWPAMMENARLLYDKDNRPDALAALEIAVSLNDRAAEAWRMRGRLAVDAFDFDNAEAVARELDNMTRAFTGDEGRHAPYAGAVEARRWLRQNEPSLALEALAPTLARHPDMPDALALEAAATAQLYQFDEAERLLGAFAARFPSSPLALYTVGAALAENRQYERAADYLRRAASLEPKWPAPLIELGLLEMQSGRDSAALEALSRAVDLDPFHVRADNSLRLIRDLLNEFETIESEHFVVRHGPGADAAVAREMLPHLEEMHAVVAEAIDHEPAQKTVIELMPDHKWFAVRILGMPDIHTIAASTGPVIAMEAPRIGPAHEGEYDWVRVVRHEYTHTVTLSRTNNRIPHWFTEAAAVHLELAPRDYQTCELLVTALLEGRLFDMRKINLAFVRPEGPNDRAQAYAQGHWMYEYIIHRFGEDAPLKLMDLYAEGLRESQAMPQALGVTQEEFVEGFKAWARDEAAAWGMIADPPLTELMLTDALADPTRRETLARALALAGRSAALALAGLGSSESLPIELPQLTEEAVNRWLGVHPEHPDLLNLAASYAIRGGVTPGALPLLERYARARPVDPTPHQKLAAFYLDHESEEATRAVIEHLRYLDAREQRSTAYTVELASRHVALGELDEAQRAAERATTIAPYDPGHRELAARIALLSADLETAQRHIEALTLLEPDRDIHKERLERIKALRAARG